MLVSTDFPMLYFVCTLCEFDYDDKIFDLQKTATDTFYIANEFNLNIKKPAEHVCVCATLIIDWSVVLKICPCVVFYKNELI